MNDQTAAILEVVVPALHQAGEIALASFRTGVNVDDKPGKGYFDPVTVADRGVETHLRSVLHEAFPGDQVIGEEEGTSGGGGALDAAWIIDPIDGTGAFVTGSPQWGILLGRVVEGRCTFGALRQPFLGETLVGDGTDAWLYLDGEPTPRPLRASGTRTLGEAAIGCTTPFMFAPGRDRAAFEAIAESARMTRFGGDCYGYALVAMGHLDLVVEAQLQPYDILPLVALIEGAGGVVTDLSGQTPHDGGFVIAAANPDLHAEALALAREAGHA